MAAIKFYLKEPKSKTDTAIFLIATIGDKSFKIYVSQSLNPINWDRIRQRVVVKRNGSNLSGLKADRINQDLNTIRGRLEPFLDDCELNDHLPSKTELEEIAVGKRIEIKRSRKSVFEYIDEFIESPIKDKSGMVKNREYSTVRSIRSMKTHLSDYCEASRRQLSFASFNSTEVQNFGLYLTNKGLQDSTRAKTLKDLRAFLKWSKSNGYIKRDIPKITVPQYRNNKLFFLTEDEILKLEEIDLSEDQELDLARDIFLIQIWSGGQRISDIKRLNPSWIKKDRMEFFQQKTKKEMSIPISKRLKRLLEKYEYKLPQIRETPYNVNLRALAKRAKLYDEVKVFETKGGNKVDKDIPKWELMSSHRARNTFIMYALDNGMSTFDVMRYTGHEDIKSLQKYVDFMSSKKADFRFLNAIDNHTIPNEENLLN